MSLLNSNQKKLDYLNTVSHAIGLLYSIIGLPVLIYYASYANNWRAMLGVIIFGLALCAIYLTSTLFHATSRLKVEKRYLFQKFDHIAIYFFIAASYTPFIILHFRTTGSYIILILLWLFVLFGTIFKWYYTGKYVLASTLIYVFMGWLGIFLIQPIYQTLDSFTITLLVSGGIVYSIGAVFYYFEHIKYYHFIWHLHVMLASFLHYLALVRSLPKEVF